MMLYHGLPPVSKDVEHCAALCCDSHQSCSMPHVKMIPLHWHAAPAPLAHAPSRAVTDTNMQACNVLQSATASCLVGVVCQIQRLHDLRLWPPALSMRLGICQLCNVLAWQLLQQRGASSANLAILVQF